MLDSLMKHRFFLIEDEQFLKKCNNMWDKISNIMQKSFDSEPLYNEKYLKTKSKSFNLYLIMEKGDVLMLLAAAASENYMFLFLQATLWNTHLLNAPFKNICSGFAVTWCAYLNFAIYPVHNDSLTKGVTLEFIKTAVHSKSCSWYPQNFDFNLEIPKY